MGNAAGPGEALLGQLAEAVNRRDPGAVEACFAPGYRNETPAHPAQGFTGRDGVVVFGVGGGGFTWARFFLEAVETGGPDVNAAVRQHAGAGAGQAPETGAGSRQ